MPFSRRGNWGLKKFSYLPNIAQLKSGGNSYLEPLYLKGGQEEEEKAILGI